MKFSGDVSSHYNAVIKMRSMFTVGKSDGDLIKLMAQKVNLAAHLKMIIDHLNGMQPNNFEVICRQISTVQQLTGIQAP